MRITDLLADHETVADAPPAAAGGDPSPAPAAPSPAAEPAGPPSPETAPPAAAADPFAEYGLQPEDVRELAEFLPLLRQAAQQPTGPEQPAAADQMPDFDPFDPESMSRYFDARDQRMLGNLQQLISPLTQAHETQVFSEAENRALDILRDDATRNGEFAGGDSSLQMARSLADSLLGSYQERYGPGPRAAEAALTAAGARVRAIEKSVGDAAVERYKNQLATLARAPQEQGVTSAAPPAQGEYKDELEAAAAFMNRMAQPPPNVGL